ncbi:GyrI-like domain-containing protein [Nocardia sp. NPDC051570]|uniref:GyrI-like domain-containing protein n=1 Tax=Nocardia sp. NPDC051570 TaxID=3364324 RepID=UPI0037924C9B
MMHLDPKILRRTRITPTGVIHTVLPDTELADFRDWVRRTLPVSIVAQGAAITGFAFALYRPAADGLIDVELGFPIDRRVPSDDYFTVGLLPTGHVAQAVHTGTPADLAQAWKALRQWMDGRRLEPAALRWETYLDAPTIAGGSGVRRTELAWPIEPVAVD